MNRYMLLVLLLFFPEQAFSQIYKCDGTWSSTPCDENSKAIEDLPPISRGKTVPPYPVTESLEKADEESDTADTGRSGCDVVSSGARLILSEVRFIQDEKGRVLSGRLRNDSHVKITNPIEVAIETDSRSNRHIEQIGDSLNPGQETAFSFSLPEDLTVASQIKVYVYYSPASVCPSKTIDIPASFRTDLQQRNYVLKELKDDLRSLDRHIKSLLRKRGTELRFSDQSFLNEFRNIDQTYKRICLTRAQSELEHSDRNRLQSDCYRTRELIQDLTNKAQSFAR